MLEKNKDEIFVKFSETECKLKSVQLELQGEIVNRSEETAAWSKSVSEKSRLCENLQTQVRELQNELASVRRKHAINLKVKRRNLPVFQIFISNSRLRSYSPQELSRELKITRKRLDQLETSSTITTNASNSNDGTSLGSRTSSNTSINTTGLVSIPSQV